MRVFLAMLLWGCATTDRDGDGFDSVADGGTDCDDINPAVNPGMVEVCDDALDNDCDGVVDDNGSGAVDWFVDSDGDGWGTGAAQGAMCVSQLALGQTDRSGDCDDSSSLVHPGVLSDDCNGVDDDCDSLLDEDFGAVRVADTAYDSLAEALEAEVSNGTEVVAEICLIEAFHPIPDLEMVGGSLSIRTVRDGQRAVLEAAEGGTSIELSGGAEFGMENVTVAALSGDLEITAEGASKVQISSAEWLAASHDAAIEVSQFAEVRLDDNSVSTDGDLAVRVLADGRGVITGSNLEGRGAELELRAGTLTLEDTDIEGCSTAIDVYGASTLLLEEVQIQDCDTAIRSDAGTDVATMTVREGSFTDNGAGIATQGGIELILSDVLIAGSTTGRALGVLGAGSAASSVSLTEVTIEDNLAGGARIEGPVTVDAEQLTIADNQALKPKYDREGGGLQLFEVVLQGSGSTVVSGNEAMKGGGIALLGACDVQGVTVTNNVAQRDGGGVWQSPPTQYNTPEVSTLTDTTIADNTASQGGGIYKADGMRMEWHNLSVLRNNGGGAHADVRNTGYVSIFDCDFGTGANDNTPVDMSLSTGVVYTDWEAGMRRGCSEAIQCNVNL